MTAVLEVENKETLDKLLKMAKIAGLCVKRRRSNSVSVKRQLSSEDRRRIVGEQGMKIFRDIRQRVIDAGETMTMDEINAEIAEYRREKRTNPTESFMIWQRQRTLI